MATICPQQTGEKLLPGAALPFTRRGEKHCNTCSVSNRATTDLTAPRAAFALEASGFHFQLSFSYGNIQNFDATFA